MAERGESARMPGDDLALLDQVFDALRGDDGDVGGFALGDLLGDPRRRPVARGDLVPVARSNFGSSSSSVVFIAVVASSLISDMSIIPAPVPWPS